MGQDAMILVYWMLSFKPAFSLSSFTLIKRHLSPLHFLLLVGGFFFFFEQVFCFLFLFFYFTILYWFCHTSTWIHHGCTRVPKTLSAIRVVSSVYLRLLIFLPAIWISLCDSSSPVFLIIYSACKLNKQGDSILLWCPPFPVLSQSLVPCLILTVASWTAYRFLKWSGISISLRILHSFLWSTQSKALE